MIFIYIVQILSNLTLQPGAKKISGCTYQLLALCQQDDFTNALQMMQVLLPLRFAQQDSG